VYAGTQIPNRSERFSAKYRGKLPIGNATVDENILAKSRLPKGLAFNEKIPLIYYPNFKV
jgi:hypothetical protein